MTPGKQTTVEAVRSRYASAADTVLTGGAACCGDQSDPITGNLYTSQETRFVPMDALSASLGCGNPTALAELNEGENVLDLGSGGATSG